MSIIREGKVIRAEPGKRLRVVLLTSDDPQHRYLQRLLDGHAALVATVVEPGTAQQRRLWARRRYRDAVYRAYQGYRQRVTGRARHRRRYFETLERELPAPGSPTHVVSSMNDPSTRDLVRSLAPDLTVVCGTGVLGRKLIAAVPGLIVNLHTGLLPHYRGNHCIYFAFRRQDWDGIAATLHVLTPELDAGPILAVVEPDLYPHDNDEHLYARAAHLAALRLIRLIRELEQGHRLTAVPQETAGTMFRHRDRGPIGEIRLWFRRRTGRHSVPVKVNDSGFDVASDDSLDTAYAGADQPGRGTVEPRST